MPDAVVKLARNFAALGILQLQHTRTKSTRGTRIFTLHVLQHSRVLEISPINNLNLKARNRTVTANVIANMRVLRRKKRSQVFKAPIEQHLFVVCHRSNQSPLFRFAQFETADGICFGRVL